MDIETLLEHVYSIHYTMIYGIECCRHVQEHISTYLSTIDGCNHVVVEVDKCSLGRVLSAVGGLVEW